MTQLTCSRSRSEGGAIIRLPWETWNSLSMRVNADSYLAIVVLDGSGYRQGAEQWLRGQAGNNRLRHVLDLGGFQRFASREEL